MKYLKTIVYLLMAGILGYSCQKDNNSYLQEKETITIEGINDTYNSIADKDILEISPEVKSTYSEPEFEYTWTVYPANVTGEIPKVDTISNTLNLNYKVELLARKYNLVFSTKNKKTGLTAYRNVELVVNTEYTRGWYVLKDDGKDSDLDQFFTVNSIIPSNAKNEDIFSRLNGYKILGKGLRLTFLSDYKSTLVSSTPSNTRTLFVGTENEISAIYINNLREYRNKNSLFFSSPMEIKNGVVFQGNGGQYIINNNHLFGISTAVLNSGIFGSSAMRDDYNSPYELSPYFLTSNVTPTLLYDNKSSTFLSAAYAPEVLSTVNNKNGESIGKNQYCNYMGLQKKVYDAKNYVMILQGPGIFENTLTGEKSLIQMEFDSDGLTFTKSVIPLSLMLYNAKNYTVLAESENLLYYSNGGNVYSYGLTSKLEQLQYTLPAGEEVTFIRHRKYSESGYEFDYVMIGSKAGNNYRIRMFEKLGGNLKSVPAFSLEGKGEAKDVIYISPSVSSQTFPNSY